MTKKFQWEVSQIAKTKFLHAMLLGGLSVNLNHLKIGRNHTAEHNAQRLNERHFITNIPGGEGKKKKRPTRSCFVCSKLPSLNCKLKRTSFWCEDCGKPLCITPCFKIYHTEIDFKLHALKFRQEGTQTVLVQGVEGNDGDDNL